METFFFLISMVSELNISAKKIVSEVIPKILEPIRKTFAFFGKKNFLKALQTNSL
jgi:hypothetical protein